MPSVTVQRDDAEFGEALDEEGEVREGDKEGGGGGGSGLPWEGDDKRDYKYEELLGELCGPADSAGLGRSETTVLLHVAWSICSAVCISRKLVHD